MCANIRFPAIRLMKKYSILLVILGSMLWGTDSLFRRPLTQELSPVTIVFLEHCILCIVMIPVLWSAKSRVLTLSPREWLSLSFIALGGSVAATSLFTFSIKYGNPSVTVLLQKTQPLLTILLARWLLREKPGRQFWLWLTPALGGAYLISAANWREGFTFEPYQAASIVAALGASALWGASTVFGRYVASRIPALTLTGLRFVIALPVLSLMYCLEPMASRRIPSTFSSQASLVAMALIPGLLALVFYYKGLQTTMASMASIGELAFPVTAVVANWFFLDIHLTGTQILGGSLLVISVTALTYLDARAKQRAANQPI